MTYGSAPGAFPTFVVPPMVVALRWSRVLLTAGLVALAGLAQAAGKEGEFSAPKEKVYQVALEVIATEWRIEHTDKESGTISFRSGMSMSSWKGQDMSLLVMETEPGKSKILANSEKRGGQLGTWGEGGKLQKKAIRLIAEKLFKDGLIPQDEVPKK